MNIMGSATGATALGLAAVVGLTAGGIAVAHHLDEHEAAVDHPHPGAEGAILGGAAASLLALGIGLAGVGKGSAGVEQALKGLFIGGLITGVTGMALDATLVSGDDRAKDDPNSIPQGARY